MPTWIDPVDVTPGTLGSYQDVDVSAHAPAGTTGVMLHTTNDNLGAKDFRYRKNGSTDARTFDISGQAMVWVAVGVDASRICEVWVEDAAQEVWLVGYFGSEAHFFTNATDVSGAAISAWEDIGISAYCGSDTPIAAILEIGGTNYNGHAFRKKGSTDSWTAGDSTGNDASQHGCFIVPVDGAGVFQSWRENTGRKAYLTGYITSGVAFLADATDLGVGAPLAFADLTALPTGATGAFIEVHRSPYNQLSAVRKNGSAEDFGLSYGFHSGTAMVECDASGIIEGRLSTAVSAHFYLRGYAVEGVAAIPTPPQGPVHSIWLFNPQERLDAALVNPPPGACPYWGDRHTRRLDGSETLTVTMPGDHAQAVYAVIGGRVMFSDLDGEPRVFEIIDVFDTTSGNGAERALTCEGTAQAELLAAIVRPTEGEYTLSQAVALAIAGTRWSAGQLLGTGSHTFSWEYDTAWKCIQDILIAFDLELRVTFTVAGNVVTSRKLDFVSRVGTDTRKFIEYGRDTTMIRRHSSGRQLYTALVGVGGNDASGNPVTFTSVTWTTAGGDPRDKPTAQDWLGDDDARLAYGLPYEGVRLHRVGLYKSDTTDTEILLTQTNTALDASIVPQDSYTVSLVMLEQLDEYTHSDIHRHERVRLGDSVVVRDLRYSPPIAVVLRVCEETRSKADPSAGQVLVGDELPSTSVIAAQVGALERFVRRD